MGSHKPFVRRRQWHPTPVLLPGKPMDGGAWWAVVHGVAKSRTWLGNFPFTFHFHALEKEMATHSTVLAWRIPGMGKLGGLLSLGSHRVGHDWSDLAAAAAANLLWMASFHLAYHLQESLMFCMYWYFISFYQQVFLMVRVSHVCLTIHQLIDIWVFGLLHVMLLWTFGCSVVCRHKLSFLLGLIPKKWNCWFISPFL